MRLIDADRLMKHLMNWALHENATEILECMDAVAEQPTVDKMHICKNCRWARLANAVIEHGYWIAENSRPKSSMFYCSECHSTCYDIQPNAKQGWEKRCRYNYCPNCGAKMDEVIE